MCANAMKSYTYDEQEMIDQIKDASDDVEILPSSPYEEYDQSQLIRLIHILLAFIAFILAKVEVTSVRELGEKLDQLNFSAHKDSHTSSMRPSSDMPRRKKAESADDSEDDVESSTCNEPNEGGQSSEGNESKGIEDSDSRVDDGAENEDRNGQTTDKEEKDSGDAKAEGSNKAYADFTSKEAEAEKNLRKDHKRSRRNPTGRKPGKQPGAKGFGFKIPETVVKEDPIVIPPAECASCPSWNECKQHAKLGAGHNVFDIRVIVTQTVYQTATVACPKNGSASSSEMTIDAAQENVESGVSTNRVPAENGSPAKKTATESESAMTDSEELADNNQGSETISVEGENSSPTSEKDVQKAGQEATQTVFSSQYPEGATGPNQYGTHIKVLVCLLYCIGMVSLNRIHAILGPWLCMQLSEATMLGFIREMAMAIQPVVDAILAAEHEMNVVHLDETGTNVGGKLYWVHCVATPLYTFVSIQRKRGKEGMDKIGFLATYVGTIVHDCWASYWKNDKCFHALCNEHIERELAGISKFFENASKWADDMLVLLQEMLHAKHGAQEQKLECLPTDKLKGFSDRYDELIARGKELHPILPRPEGKRGRLKKGRARALIDRMEEHKAEVFRFLTDFSVPYTNNEAERCFRMLGLRRSVGFFQTLEFAEYFCATWSYLSTARKHGISYFKAAEAAFDGTAMELIFPKPTDQAE